MTEEAVLRKTIRKTKGWILKQRVYESITALKAERKMLLRKLRRLRLRQLALLTKRRALQEQLEAAKP